MNGLRFDGWVPCRLYWQAGEPGVEWCYLGSHRFCDPFFETTMHFEVQTPFNSLFRFRTPIAALADWRAFSPGLPPAGFIFHLSRCGSTLITNLLGSLPQNLVLSEPGLLDRMIRSHVRAPWASVEQRVAWLQWLVSALGQPRTGAERRLFIKFDPRSIVDFPLIRLAFPDVPWVFVYRDPVEVMVSNIRGASPLVNRGVLGLDFLMLDTAEIAVMDDDEYAARVLAIVAEAGARHAAANHGMLITYPQLPHAVWGSLQRHFGISLTAEEREQLKQAAMFNAKRPRERFVSDIESKQTEATGRVRALADQWLMPHYARLEELRRAQSAQRFKALRSLALENPPLFERLRGLPGREAFLEASLQAAAEAGLALDRADIEAALAEAAWLRGQRAL